MLHIPVLLKETISALNLQPGFAVVDGTLGSGGHAKEILKAITPGTFIGLDVDSEALQRARTAINEEKLEGNRVHLVQENFRNLRTVLERCKVREVQAVLLDLGWSSDQFEKSGRGFSFNADEPLLMTLGDYHGTGETAKDVVNTYSAEDLADLIYTLGEEQFSRRIASGIVEARKRKTIESTVDLVRIIEASVPKFYLFRRIHPATKTFQALRIHVNDELNALRDGLLASLAALSGMGRLAVITFHSLEDRIVKQTFREWVYESKGSLITKKPIQASAEEIQRNKRSRSAKVRIFEKAG